MEPIYLFMIGCFTLIAWGLVFLGSHPRQLARAAARQGERRKYGLEHSLHVLGRANLAANAGNCYKGGSNGLGSLDRKARAETYLRRVVALTGATQAGPAYILDVGKIRFQVSYRSVTRFQDLGDSQSPREETCFYPVNREMPRAEEVATALLQLANDPALFEKWANQRGLAFKADGQVFTRTQ
jgi:hypothetical protein